MKKLRYLCYRIACLDSTYRRFPPYGGGLGVVYHWPKNIVLRLFARLASSSAKDIHGTTHWLFGRKEPLNELIFRYRCFLRSREAALYYSEYSLTNQIKLSLRIIQELRNRIKELEKLK